MKPYYRQKILPGWNSWMRRRAISLMFAVHDSTGDWRIREEIDAVDPEEANRAARSAVAAGAEEIAFLQRCDSRTPQTLECCSSNLQEIPVHFAKCRRDAHSAC